MVRRLFSVLFICRIMQEIEVVQTSVSYKYRHTHISNVSIACQIKPPTVRKRI